MNLHPVVLRDAGAELADQTVSLPSRIREAASAARVDHVTLGFRPEAVSVTSEGEGIPAQIDVVEELGSDAYVYCHLLSGPEDEQGDGRGWTGERVASGARSDSDPLEVVARAPGRSGARPGDRISVVVSPEDLHAFHPDTGERLSGR